ncbi:MAG: serine hydrolase domain-containing protein [Planctomycetaceae bacterium]
MAFLMGRKENRPVVRTGRQQIKHSKPQCDDSIYLVASITKPIVATAIMRLTEQGKLSLNDKVRHYIQISKGQVRTASP